MGGKVWSTEEERVFWEIVVPVSPHAANPAKRLLTWPQCAELMTREVGANARREYTNTMLYEHHYQNFKPGAKSPKANPFLEKHLRDIEWFKENKTSPPPTPAQAPTSDDSLASLLNEINKPKPKTKRGRKAAPPADDGPKFTAAQLYKLATGRDLPERTSSFKPVNQSGRNSLTDPAAKATVARAAKSGITADATPAEVYKFMTGRELGEGSSSFTPINQGGRNSLTNPIANTATTSASNTVANSFVNPAASTATDSFAKLAIAPAASSFANSFANPFASNSGSAPGSLASGQPKPSKAIRRQAKATKLAQPVRQPTPSQASVTQPSSGPNALLSRQPQSFGSGIRGTATTAHQDVQRTQGLTTATTTQVQGSSSYVPFYQSYATTSQQTPTRASYQTFTQASRQSSVQPTFQTPAPGKEEGPLRLPSIREMFPFTFTGPEQEVFARREADAMLQNRKRSISVEDEQMPAPKRRPLPDRPTTLQN
ncbi:Hypothetical protein NCS54_01156700 [Fusarium falciforme]|uniref:Hypothetical protein n=1 Tax=Fusarium falciforme TaxID=195108 RepID=UPI0023007795|nr:Hypothetical protein NCS54_01156700 [Fusarium falciforme]WAO94005.1 Hypothetical protein NCS54_01156700 [Fusarium falciforme]